MDSRLLAQDEERLRLGRELHDSTGQLLLALRLGISHLKQVHGTGADGSDLAQRCEAYVEQAHPIVDVVVYDGGQERYPLLLAVE